MSHVVGKNEALGLDSLKGFKAQSKSFPKQELTCHLGITVSEGSEQEARTAMLQYFGALAQHWSTILVAIGLVFFSVMQFREEFWRAGLLETALLVLGAQGVYAGSRVILHGWYCELAVRVQLGANCTNQVARVHDAMLRRLRQERPWALKF